MEIPGWRLMAPAELDVAIRTTILQRGHGAVRVVERRAAGPVSFVGIAMTVPIAVWRMFTAESWPERTSWLAWIWVAYFTAGLLSRFAPRRTARILSLKSAPSYLSPHCT